MPFLKATKNGKSYYSRIWYRYFEDYKWNLLTGTKDVVSYKFPTLNKDFITKHANKELTISFDAIRVGTTWDSHTHSFIHIDLQNTGATRTWLDFLWNARTANLSTSIWKRYSVKIKFISTTQIEVDGVIKNFHISGTQTQTDITQCHATFGQYEGNDFKIKNIKISDSSEDTEYRQALSEYTIYDRPDKVGIPAYTFKVDSPHTINFGSWTLKPNEKYRVSVTFRTRGDGDSTLSKCSSVGFIAHTDNWKYSRQYIHSSKQAYEERGKIVKWTYEFTVDKIVEATCNLCFIIQNAWVNGYDNQTIDLYKADFKNYEIPKGNPAIYNRVSSQYDYFFKDSHWDAELSSLEIKNNKEYLCIIPEYRPYSSDSKAKFLIKNYKPGSSAEYGVLISASFYTYSSLETIKYLDLLFHTY